MNIDNINLIANLAYANAINAPLKCRYANFLALPAAKERVTVRQLEFEDGFAAGAIAIEKGRGR